MLELLVKSSIRVRFKLSRAAGVCTQIRKTGDAYLAFAENVDPQRGSESREVPAMFGVDEDMRNWSFFMTLEHNVIVNRNITSLVGSLARGEVPEGIDPKNDVMPSANPGVEQVEAFRSSIADHIDTVAKLGKLRGTVKKRHPIFGRLDAHGWHCMFGLHLTLHVKQAQLLARESAFPEDRVAGER